MAEIKTKAIIPLLNIRVRLDYCLSHEPVSHDSEATEGEVKSSSY